MSKSTAKQLKQARKQIESVAHQLELDKRLVGVAGKAGLAKRRKVLGVPVSRPKPSWGRIVSYGAVAAAGAAGTRMLSGRANHHGTSEGEQTDRLAEAVERGAAKGAEEGIARAVGQDD